MRLAALAPSRPFEPFGVVGLEGVYCVHAALISMAGNAGYRAVRLDMRFALRTITEDDVQAVAALHVATFNETHTVKNDGPSYALRASQWRAAFQEPAGNWFGVVIENEAGELVGFAKGKPHDGGVPGFQGELNKIYLLRRHHRLGLGRRLLCDVAQRFLDRGMSSMLLFGEATNPSNGFYEAMGGERLFARNGEFHGAYGWRDLHALVTRCRSFQG